MHLGVFRGVAPWVAVFSSFLTGVRVVDTPTITRHFSVLLYVLAITAKESYRAENTKARKEYREHHHRRRQIKDLLSYTHILIMSAGLRNASNGEKITRLAFVQALRLNNRW